MSRPKKCIKYQEFLKKEKELIRSFTGKTAVARRKQAAAYWKKLPSEKKQEYCPITESTEKYERCTPFLKFKRIVRNILPELNEMKAAQREKTLKTLWKRMLPLQRLGFCDDTAEYTRMKKALRHIKDQKLTERQRTIYRKNLCANAKIKDDYLGTNNDTDKWFTGIIRSKYKTVKSKRKTAKSKKRRRTRKG